MMPTPSGPSAFQHLHPSVQEWVRARGWTSATPIQEMAWPVLARGGDALLVAPTGTGKTEAALFPLLGERLDRPSPPVSLIYVTPLRALNRDLEGRIASLVKALGLRAGVRHGDTPGSVRTRQAKDPPDVLITTPETLQLLITGKLLRRGMVSVQTVVVDEVHELASSDRGAQLMVTLERLDTVAGRPVRRIGLSATVGNPREMAQYLSPHREATVLHVPSPRSIELEVRMGGEGAITVSADLRASLKVDQELFEALLSVHRAIREHRSTLVFVNTRPTAEALAARLRRLDPELPIAVHHGSLSREVREEAENAFREGSLRALVATSSLELGIDVGVADHVVQFGSPHQVSRLLQRVGRSGHRQDAISAGTIIALDEEDLEEAAVLSRRALDGKVEEIRVRHRNRLALAQQLVALLRADGEVPSAESLRLLRRAVPTRDLSDAETADLVSFLERLGSVRERGGRLAPSRGTLQRFYATLSLIPEEKTYSLRDLGTRRILGTLDERFVVTQILARPDFLFLLHGTTWRVVEFRESELLVEAVQEIGAEPRWVGEDIPVPVEVAQEIGRRRREGSEEDLPLSGPARARLRERFARLRSLEAVPTDRTITVEIHHRLAVIGSCFGTRINTTLATLLAGRATERLGGRVDVQLIEPTWIVLSLPEVPPQGVLEDLFRISPDEVGPLLRRWVPSGMEYQWTFATVARKFGLLPLSADARRLRTLEPLLEANRETPLGLEALEKTLHEQFDPEGTARIFRDLAEGRLGLAFPSMSAPTLGRDVLDRLNWQRVADQPPPTLLRAVRERLDQETLLLVCIRCGFQRSVTPRSFREGGGSPCLICHSALSAVFSPRREADVRLFTRYVQAKRKGKYRQRLTAEQRRLVEAAYLSADLLLTSGFRALQALAARGIGPEKARQILLNPSRPEEQFLGEVIRAERAYAQTRAFWD